MAHMSDNNQGPRGSINVDVNIVPFIDLMSVLVIFLLITAVWTQVSMIQIGSSIYAKKTDDQKVVPPPNAEVPFRMDVRADGHRVILGKQQFAIPKKDGEYDLARLLEVVKQVKIQYPDKTDAAITVSDSIQYLHLIQGMDILLQAGFPEIGVATGGAE
jgi:biopolymer transport protein TolR